MAVALADDHVDCVFLLNKTLFMAMALCHVNCVSCFFGAHESTILAKLNMHCLPFVNQVTTINIVMG